MRRTISLAVLVLGAAVLGAPFAAVADSDQPYIVLFDEAVISGAGNSGKPDRTRVGERVSDAARRGGFKVNNVFDTATAGFSARLTRKQVRALEADPSVASVVPDVAVSLDGPGTQDGQITANVVTVSGAKVPAGVKRVGARENSFARIDKVDQRVDVDVAILDTGIDRTHSDLNVAGGYNCTGSNRDNWNDVNGHGTHVAGTVAALDNDFGVVGVAPGARLWAVKVMGNDGTGLMSWIICGIDWVAAQRDGGKARIEVANTSFRATGDGRSRDCGVPTGDAMHKAICRAVSAGTVFVAAAGNDKRDARYARPAAFDETITVSALADYDGRPGGYGSRPSGCGAGGADDAWASFSNYGSRVSLIAPGVCVLSTYSDGRYAYAAGTSMAAPHVAGGAALYLAQYPEAKPQQVRMALQYVATYDWRQGTDPDGKPDRLMWVGDFAPPPDFSVAGGLVGGSGYLNSGSNTLPVSLRRSNGHNESITVTVNGLPDGVTVTPGSTRSTTATVNLNVLSSVRSGRYPVTLRGTDGELVRTANFELAIDNDAPSAAFTSPAREMTMQPVASAKVAWTEADAGGSGVAGRTLQRQRGLPSAAGDCTATTWTDVGSTRTVKDTYTDRLTDGYCYRWVLVVRDRAGNRTTVVSGLVLVDASAPSRPDAGVAGATSSVGVPGSLPVPSAWVANEGTIWVRGGGSGRVDLALAARDSQSGISGFSLASDGSAGWTVPATADASPRLAYSSTAGTLSVAVRAVNGAGLKGSAETLTLKPDGTRPASGTWATPAGKLAVVGTSVLLSWSGGSDSGSGLNDAHFVRRQRAPATSSGGCGTFSVDGPAVLMASGTIVEGLRPGYCYRWRLRTTDRVGNMAAAVLSGRVRVTSNGPEATLPPAGAPVVSEVTTTLAEGSRLTTGKAARVVVDWTSLPAGSAISSHQVRVSRDGGSSWASATTTSADRTRLKLTLAPGGGYVVGVRSADGEGNWSDWATTPVFSVRVAEAEGTAATFAGVWTKASPSKASGGAVRYSKSAGASATFTFTGRSIALVATTGPTRGKVDVLIDGETVRTVDLYSATTDYRRLVFMQSWSSSASHTIEVRVKGTSGRPRVDLDAFAVLD